MDGRKRIFPGRINSIRSTIFAATSLLVLCMVLIVTAVSVRYTRSSIYDNAIVYTQTIITQMNQNIDSYIDYMDNIAALISGSVDTGRFLYGYKNRGSYRKGLEEQFEIILKSRSDIRNIGVVRRRDIGRDLFNTGRQQRNNNVDLDRQEWYKSAVGNYSQYTITSSHVQHVISGQRPWVITLSRGIENLDKTGESDGVVFIDLNYSAISELCDQNSIGARGYVFIVDQNGNIVYHPQQQQLYNELQTESIDAIMQAESDTVTVGSGENARIYTLSHSEKTGWTVVGCMNMAELTRGSREAQSIYIVMAIALVIVALIFSNVIAGNITLPIKRLQDSMKKVQEGDFSAAEEIRVSSQSEINDLAGSFQMMTERIEELMEQNIREQEQKRKIEMKALQSQINPHFLYNTLDSIIWMAEGKKNEEVVLMTASLARLLRQSIGNEDEVVPLGQEIEYARSYLTIQKMRYKDKLEFQIQVSPEVSRVQIVKLVLQPIIENAIYHGLKYKESRGLLSIRAYAAGENVIIEIADNGVGMEPETLQHIFEKHKVNYRSNGVGVYNVQKRLQLYYGNHYGITYTSEKGKGTTAVITIPGFQEVKQDET